MLSFNGIVERKNLRHVFLELSKKSCLSKERTEPFFDQFPSNFGTFCDSMWEKNLFFVKEYKTP